MKWRSRFLPGLGILPLIAGLALAGPAIAQSDGKPRRVGVLLMIENCPAPPALIESLAALGWVEGRTVVFDCVSAAGPAPFDRLNALAAELVSRRPDVIVGSFLPVARALKAATATIPIVMLDMAEPVRRGLVESLSRPGGNLTGLVSVMSEVEIKRIELLKEAVPNLRRLAVIAWQGAEAGYYEGIEQDLAGAARALGFTYQWFRFDEVGEVARLFADISSKGFDAIYLAPAVWLYTDANTQLIGNLSQTTNLPTIADDRRLAEAGVLLTYGHNNAYRFQRTASYIDKIFKGAKPADLPVEQPTKFELTINLRTAKALGIEVPLTLLIRADEVIE